MKSKNNPALSTVKLCATVLDEKKAGDVLLLDVSAQSSITDYLIIATATSAPHLRALRVELEKALDAVGVRILGMESPQESGWVVIDLFDVMVHLFLEEARARYGLERLWRDAVEVTSTKARSKPAKARPARKGVRKPGRNKKPAIRKGQA